MPQLTYDPMRLLAQQSGALHNWTLTGAVTDDAISGLPATATLRRQWRQARPDAVYVATEGPLGWSALRAARQLGIPAATGFHTRFDEYMRDYGAAFLQQTALRWMRRFHNGAQATLVPTRELQDFLEGQGFHNVVRLARAVDTGQFDPAHRDPVLRAI